MCLKHTLSLVFHNIQITAVLPLCTSRLCDEGKDEIQFPIKSLAEFGAVERPKAHITTVKTKRAKGQAKRK